MSELIANIFSVYKKNRLRKVYAVYGIVLKILRLQSMKLVAGYSFPSMSVFYAA